ncbi:MAG TPA: Re/Si-specific NAD(P)(+) transhydrogenase subunit alpha [Candidatus Acidoferrales bacterium]|nr:Re/Si-specific NAD(P)(+) transhydrogenase subunit alpha [Candidatus Acidoferrales bacterium]
MIVAVPREAASNERRVALVPETVIKLIKAGGSVRVQRNAGTAAAFPDDSYTQAGASIVDDPAALVSDADLVVTVGKPAPDVLAAMHANATLVAFLNPLGEPSYIEQLARAGLTVLAMEMIPRITRAQSMDALSSQSNIAGYKAVLLAAAALPKFFPMLTTAAGTIPPAKALILGAGVAGLQAIATARRLGAVVSGYDVRAVVKEQVQSLGATFLEFDLGGSAEAAGGYARELTPQEQERQRAWMVEQIGKNDVVVTTALVPGRRAPVLITEAAVAAMKPGSVIVDIAAEAGGNCALTKAGETVVSPNGVSIIGAVNLPSTMPYNASQLYSRNVYALISPFIKDGNLVLDPEDDVIKGACIARGGRVLIGGAAS